MSELNINQFSHLARKLLEKYQDGESFLLGDVYRQVMAAYNKFPEDAVIRQMASVLEKMSEKQSSATIINQGQLSKIYNDLVRLSSDTKFRMVLGHLLFPAPEMKRTAATNLHDSCDGLTIKDLIDPTAQKVLDSAFSDDRATRAYNERLANKGLGYVKADLKAIGMGSPQVKLARGDANGFMYTASFDTVGGLVSVYVPVKVAGDNVELPTCFIDDSGEQRLAKDTLAASLERRGGVAGDSKSLFGSAEVIRAEVEVPRAEMPKELAHLVDFESAVLEAASTFGKRAVDAGKQLVIRELKAAGFKSAQVRYGSDSNDSVIYLAGLNTATGKVDVEIPVEMSSTSDYQYVPLMPTCFAYDETLQAFNAANLQKFASTPHTERIAESNTLYSFMLLPELKTAMIKAAGCNDLLTCEDILNHIGATFGEEDHRNAIADYQYILGLKAQANQTAEHDHVISKYAGVTIQAGKGSLRPRLANGRSMDDLVVDADGRVRSVTELEKERLNPEDQGGAVISSSQIIFS